MNDLQAKYKSVLDTIEAYPDQILQSLNDFKSIEIADNYLNFDRVVFIGMGGSALGARTVDALVNDKIKIPFEIFNNFTLPAYVNENTLIILSSYSGNTEEVVSASQMAIERKLKCFIICAGGKLYELARSTSIPHYLIDTRYNPSKQPRNAIGYAIGSVLALFNKLNICDLSADEVNQIKSVMKQVFTQNSTSESKAYKLAVKLQQKSPIIISSEHLYEVIHTSKNQFNESAKTFSAHFEIPELNHHLLEGLGYPAKLKEILHFIFVESDLYDTRLRVRYPLTEEVVNKNGYAYDVYKPKSDKRFMQVLETLTFFSLVVYHLTTIYGIDPITIPWVDYFKEKLEK